MGVKIFVEENPGIILVLTPVMIRAHEQKFSSEICFVDTTGSCDQMSTCVTFILTAHKIGGIPLACILHSGLSEDIYYQSFRILRNNLPDGFGGAGYPAVFMTDDCRAERKALSNPFPESKLLLCSFHVCQAFWRWLWENKNGIQKSDRQQIMMMFRRILYAESEEDCEMNYKLFLEDVKNENLIKYVDTYWARREEWCIAFRKSYITRGHNTNNHVESSIRVFKDIILARCKAFNSNALLEFVTDVLESYHKRRMLKHANNRVTHHDILYENFKNHSIGLDVQEINVSTYYVTSSKDKQMLYTVNTTFPTFCDCHSGIGGAYCKHICAVELKIGRFLENCPLLSEHDRMNLAYIALGSKVPENFFCHMMSIEHSNINNKTANIEINSEPPKIPISPSEDFHNSETSSSDFTNIIQDLKSEYARIVDLTEKSINKENKQVIQRFVQSLKRIKTPSQLTQFFVHKKINTTNLIHVQSTSISRRKIRAGFKAGTGRIIAGRPSHAEISVSAKRKRTKIRHSLIDNISQNRPNAKIH